MASTTTAGARRTTLPNHSLANREGFTGVSEPMPVAATFEWVLEDRSSLSDQARLDTMVTVVDASTFLGELADLHVH